MFIFKRNEYLFLKTSFKIFIKFNFENKFNLKLLLEKFHMITLFSLSSEK